MLSATIFIKLIALHPNQMQRAVSTHSLMAIPQDACLSLISMHSAMIAMPKTTAKIVNSRQVSLASCEML